MRMKAVGVFLLAFCMAALPAGAGQNQSSSPAAPPDQPAASSEPAPTQQPDSQQQTQQPNGDAAPVPAPQEPQSAPAQPTPNLPTKLNAPAGALISVRVSQWLSSDRNHAGDTFSAVLDQPIVPTAGL